MKAASGCLFLLGSLALVLSLWTSIEVSNLVFIAFVLMAVGFSMALGFEIQGPISRLQNTQDEMGKAIDKTDTTANDVKEHIIRLEAIVMSGVHLPVTTLCLDERRLVDVPALEKLDQLTNLHLRKNPDLTKAQITELQKALPNCDIGSNHKK